MKPKSSVENIPPPTLLPYITFRKIKQTACSYAHECVLEEEIYNMFKDAHLKAWIFSQRTFSNIIQLGEMTDAEFSNAVANFPSIHAGV